MASINGVSGNNMMSSLYNSRNIVSGLASGLDIEGMIEGLVQSYQQKINGLNQKVTKIGWQQEAYRSIISKMVAFTNKYTSFSSSTNLLSSSFFNNAMKVVTSGMYADRVTASGRSDSDIVLNNVSQLATSARYVTGSELNRGDGKTIEADTALDLDGKTTANTMSSTYANVAEGYGASVTPVDDFIQTIELLTSGRIDATLNAEVSFYDYLNIHPDAPVKIACVDPDSTQVAIAMPKGEASDALREAIDQALAELAKDGTLTRLSTKYFNTDISKAQ